MEGTVNKAAGLVFLLCRCGDRDFHVYLCNIFFSLLMSDGVVSTASAPARWSLTEGLSLPIECPFAITFPQDLPIG